MSVVRQGPSPLQASLLAMVHRLAEEYEWSIQLAFDGTGELLEGSVDRSNWNIALTVHPHGGDLLEQRLGLPSGEGEPHMRHLVSAACRHEIGHWEYCPCDGRWTARIVEGISRGVSHSGRQFRAREVVIRRLTNMFCDIVVNTCLAQWGRHRETFIAGKAVLYLYRWLSPTELPPDFAIFMAIQSRLYGEGEGSEPIVQRFVQTATDRMPSFGQEALDTVERCIRMLIAPQSAQGKLPSREQMAWRVAQRVDWPSKASAFARRMAAHVVEQPWVGVDVLGSGTGADETGGMKERPGGGKGRSVAHRNEARLSTPLLDLLYRARADRVELIYPSATAGKRPEFPVLWLQTRRLSEREGVPISRIRWSRTRLVPISREDEDLWLYRKEAPVTFPFGGGPTTIGFPDLAFIVDSSESMGWNPEAGEGKYDLVLRSIYALWNWVEQQGVASYLRYAAVNFSNQTVLSGWHPWQRLQPVKKVLFAYQDGSTRLDPGVLDQLVAHAARQFAAILITDGRLSNWRGVLEHAHALRQQGHFFTFIQIGKTSRLCDALSGAGFETHAVRSAKDLQGRVLGLVQRRWAPHRLPS